MIQGFRDLQVYQESFQLQIEIEEVLKIFPHSERFLLSDQMKRASRGIPSLIAEGWARRESIKDFQKYLREAIGESDEMISHLLLVKHKKYTEDCDQFISRYEVLAKKLTNLKNNWQQFK